MKNNYLSNQDMLLKYAVIFETLKNNTELAEELASYGYDEAEVAKGKAFYDKANKFYSDNIKETQQEVSAYNFFKGKMNQMTDLYAEHRKKARLVFQEKADILVNLRLKGKVATAITSLLGDVEVFYSTISKSDDLKNELQRVKLTAEEVESQLTLHNEVKVAYADYMREKGESQQATRNKDKAFEELDKWVKKFYSFAKIALADRPQLMESLGKQMKS